MENRRLQSGKVTQRQVLYLGEINHSQQAAWRGTLEVFDEGQQRYTPLSLFPEDRSVPADAIDSVRVKLSEMKLERARPYGNCWLGCELWRQLHLEEAAARSLPQQPPPRITTPASTVPCPQLKCSGDLGSAFVEKKSVFPDQIYPNAKVRLRPAP